MNLSYITSRPGLDSFGYFLVCLFAFFFFFFFFFFVGGDSTEHEIYPPRKCSYVASRNMLAF